MNTLPPGTKFTPMFTHQRAWDLLRFARAVLHNANLITDEEYALLAEDTEAVARLEDYDAVIARKKKIKRLYPCRYPKLHEGGSCPDCGHV